MDSSVIVCVYKMNSKLILIIIIVLAIELSGNGILTSLFKLLDKILSKVFLIKVSLKKTTKIIEIMLKENIKIKNFFII